HPGAVDLPGDQDQLGVDPDRTRQPVTVLTHRLAAIAREPTEVEALVSALADPADAGAEGRQGPGQLGLQPPHPPPVTLAPAHAFALSAGACRLELLDEA